jgi:hypothetical protein
MKDFRKIHAQLAVLNASFRYDIADLQDTRDLFAFDRLVLDPDGDGNIRCQLKTRTLPIPPSPWVISQPRPIQKLAH